jgi:hypothetical protein
MRNFAKTPQFSPARRLAQLEAEMRSMHAVLCLVLTCLPAFAQDSQSQDIQALQQNTTVGRGVLCDTLEQMKRFVALRDDGKAAEQAIKLINDEARNASACNMVMVMFSSRKPIAELAIHGHIVSLVELTVHAFGDGVMWKRVPEVKQYTLVPEKGQNV